MAYNTKAILVDVNGRPIPNFYDNVADVYRPWQGPDANGPLVQDSVSKAVLDDILLGVNDAVADIGETDDAVAGAGNVGTISAKLRRISADIDGLLIRFIAGTAAAKLSASTAIIGKVGVDQTTPGTTNGVQINAALPAGTNLIGKTGIDQTTPGTTNGVQVVAALPAGTNIIGKTGIDQTAGQNVVAFAANSEVKVSGSLPAFAATPTVNPGNVIKVAPVAAAKTVTTTAASLFAGASKLASRYAMNVYNESSVPVYWGPSGVTTATGSPLLPGDGITLGFAPATAVDIYFIAAASAAVRVVEVA